MNFEGILNSIELPGTLRPDEQDKRFAPIGEYLKQYMPTDLFRYRRCTERGFSAFDQNQMWMTKASKMNDGFDTRLFFDRESIYRFRDELCSTKFTEFLTGYYTPDQFPPDNIKDFPGLSELFRYFSALSEEQKRALASQAQNIISQDITNVIEVLSSATQETIKIACLSESITSPLMWGQYAGNESGFALSYDCRDYMCMPVIYSRTRFEVPSDFICFLLIKRLAMIALSTTGYSLRFPEAATSMINRISCPDILVPVRTALYKSEEWAAEKEWRLFYQLDPNIPNSDHSFINLKPTALYLGRKISHIHEKILCGIASEKSIPVFKMALNDKSPSYELVATKVN